MNMKDLGSLEFEAKDFHWVEFKTLGSFYERIAERANELLLERLNKKEERETNEHLENTQEA